MKVNQSSIKFFVQLSLGLQRENLVDHQANAIFLTFPKLSLPDQQPKGIYGVPN